MKPRYRITIVPDHWEFTTQFVIKNWHDSRGTPINGARLIYKCNCIGYRRFND